MVYSFIVFVCASVLALGQVIPQLEPAFPLAGQDNVSVSAEITIRAPANIEPRSIAINTPDAEKSGWLPEQPTVLVVRESIYEVTPERLLPRHAIVGTLTVDGSLLRWKPRALLPSTKYRCIVSGVTVLIAGGNRVCPPISFSFTTVSRTLRVEATTADTSSVIVCNQSLSISLTEPLPSPSVSQRIVTVEHRTPVGKWEPREVQIAVSKNMKAITITPRNSWSPGGEIRMHSKLSAFTGAMLDNRVDHFYVRGSSSVRVSAASVDQTTVPEEISSYFKQISHTLHADGHLRVSIPPTVDNSWRFVRWKCPSIPSLNGTSNQIVDEIIPCQLYLPELELIAILEHVDSVNLNISTDSLGTVDVLDNNGHLLGQVSNVGAVMIPTTVASVTLIATPNSNTVTFASWSSTITAVNAAPTQTIVLPMPTLVGAVGTAHKQNPAPPRIDPRWRTDPNPPTEDYRLVATIADIDPDPQFDVNTGVAFTTPRDFSDVIAGTRTVCVLAVRCWEIIGYHDPSIGPPVWFERGKQELCLSSRLLNPVNNVSIFARRKFIDLRVEKVLLGSEDPNNILVGRQPHSDTRIDVERLTVVNGVDTWVTLGTMSCVQGGALYLKYSLRCGDNIRLHAKAAKARSEEWRWWSAQPGYAIPSIERTYRDVVTSSMIIDLDVAPFDASTCAGIPNGKPEIRVQAAFRQLFGIASIGLRVRAKARGERSAAVFEERWFDPATYYEIQSDEPRSGRQLEYIPRKGTSIKVRFTVPIDGPSVLAGGMVATSADNILVTNPHATGLDFTVTTGPNGNTNFLPTTGVPADIVEFFISNPTTTPILQALHGGLIDLTCLTSLRSMYGDPLKNSHSFIIRRMELPGYGLRLVKADIGYDGDPDFWPFQNYGELYHSVYAADLAVESALLTKQGFTRIPTCGEQQGSHGECTDEYSDKKGPLSFGDRPVWLQTAWMGESDLAWWAMSSWDEDCKDEGDCLVNRMQSVIDKVRERTESYGKAETGKELNWRNILPDIVKTGADMIKALLPADDQDYHIGEATILEDNQTLWGMRTSIAPNIRARHENITYHLRGQWFVSRAVVR